MALTRFVLARRQVDRQLPDQHFDGAFGARVQQARLPGTGCEPIMELRLITPPPSARSRRLPKGPFTPTAISRSLGTILTGAENPERELEIAAAEGAATDEGCGQQQLLGGRDASFR